MADDRAEGRGRLGSIDVLPEECEPDVVWALEQLRERKMPQNAILQQFNARLADRGIAGVSKSAWGRYAVRKAIQFRRLDEVQRMSGELVASLGSDSSDQVTILIAEMLKTHMFQLAEESEITPKAVMEMSRALQSLVSAQKGSEEYRRQLERRVSSELEKAADRAETVAREAGVSAERIAQMRREFLGVGG